MIAAEREARAEWQFFEPKPQREVIRKPNPAPKQKSAAVMNSETQKNWDTWCDSRIEKMYGDIFMKAISDFVADYVQEHVTKLSAEVAELRGQLEILRAHKVSKDPAKITLVSDAA